MNTLSVSRSGVGRITIAILLITTCVAAASATEQADGWYDISSRQSDNVAGTGRSGDRLWVAGASDSFASIAETTTGSRLNAAVIARYNALHVESNPPQGTLLFVPATLLGPARDGGSTMRSEVREIAPRIEPIKPDTEELLNEPRNVRSLVDSIDVDMFAGQVDVLGEVDVTRVAIGNGAIIRAEVLASGELLVIAQTAGSSSLRLWHRDKSQTDYNIRVSENDPETRVRMQRMVRLRVRLVEFRKSALGKLGIDWADGAAGPGFAVAGDAIGNNLYRPAVEGFSGLPNTVAPFSTYFGIASNITSRINFLASSGDAVMLAEPVLSAMNGGTASFLAGGEVPYPSVGANGQTTIDFKEYGIKLNVSPHIDSAGNIRTSVETEISRLDPAVSVQGAPGLLTRRAQTEINVRSGETIVVSGLLSADAGKDIDRLPGIGRLPIIGSLFRSRNTTNSVTELVIFVTPEVIEPGGQSLSPREQDRFTLSGQRLTAARNTLPLMD